MTMTDAARRPVAGEQTVIIDGPRSAPTIVVLDPMCTVEQDTIPAGWGDVARQRRVLWSRLPAGPALHSSSEMFEQLGRQGQLVDVVASGPSAELGLDFVLERVRFARSLVLVEPSTPGDRLVVGHGCEQPEAAALVGEERYRHRIAEVERTGPSVVVIAERDEATAHQEAPPSIADPALADRVAAVLGQLDAQPEGQ